MFPHWSLWPLKFKISGTWFLPVQNESRCSPTERCQFFCFSHRFDVGEYIWSSSAGTVGHRWLSDNKPWGWDTVLNCCTWTDFNKLKYSALHHTSKQKVSLIYLFFPPKRCTLNFVLTLASLPGICSFASLGHKDSISSILKKYLIWQETFTCISRLSFYNALSLIHHHTCHMVL